MHELSATESRWDQTIKIYTNHANSLLENTLVPTSSANNAQVRSEEYEEIFKGHGQQNSSIMPVLPLTIIH